MIYQDDFTLPTELLDQVAGQGLDFLPELIRIVVNTAMQVERQKYLGVGPYERPAERQGHSNGFKPKTVSTRIAPIIFDKPQVREGGFYPQVLEKGLRSERALMFAMAEMYVQGVSTRKVAAITEKLCGSKISSTQVSRAAALLDEVTVPYRHGTVSGALAQSPVGDSQLLVPGCSVREGTG
jgi:transposase-like protein